MDWRQARGRPQRKQSADGEEEKCGQQAGGITIRSEEFTNGIRLKIFKMSFNRNEIGMNSQCALTHPSLSLSFSLSSAKLFSSLIALHRKVLYAFDRVSETYCSELANFCREQWRGGEEREKSIPLIVFRCR